MKIHKKIKIGIPEISTFSVNRQSIGLVNLKLKFWGYNEKNMGFHLTPNKVLLLVEPWGMRIQWEHTTLIESQGSVCYYNLGSWCVMDACMILKQQNALLKKLMSEIFINISLVNSEIIVYIYRTKYS